MSGESREVRQLLDKLAALDRAIAEHRTALEVDDDLSDTEIEGHRVALGMCGFQRARTLTQLKQTGWRSTGPTQGALL